ncbi:cytochrome c oxidase subunit II [Teichococcus cervicalis]|uniref:cytochrome c oxidase subunit II n=1 Tax=Teichococcus cervicalis TaxID=204525 RepID=UPI000A2F2B53|nr:cytochrome c oxidase subunit II [Pseudoroseomonas cervicalis]
MDRVAGHGHLGTDRLAAQLGNRVGHRSPPATRHHRHLRALSAATLPGFLAACDGPLSTLDPAGPGAAAVAWLWWVMLAASLPILALVCGFALYAFRRERRGQGLHVRRFVIGWGLVFPVSVLAVLLVVSLRTGEALLARPEEPDVVRVTAIGHRWWWEFIQTDAAGQALHSANELHIPAGRKVEVRIEAHDVIHSFWVPRLTGKMDAIPGHPNLLRLQADAPGVYDGQCAEFCGLQHARMRFRVRAHPPEEYAAALARLAAARPDPAHPGATPFAQNCASCHSAEPGVAGAAPNLAGLAQRDRLGAGALEYRDAGDLRLWLTRHERIKPGSGEPSHAALPAAELDAIIDYLESAR